MNIRPNTKNPNASEDLTVVLLKGNSSPRSFRIPLTRLYRSLTLVGFTFFTSLLLSGVFLLYLSYQSWTREEVTEIPPSAVVAEPTPTPAPAEPSTTTTQATATVTITATATATATVTETAVASAPAKSLSLWEKITGSTKPVAQAPADGSQDSNSELTKELQGLREDLAKANNKADGRIEVKTGDSTVTLLGQRSTLIPKAENLVDVKNIKISTVDGKTKLRFELHNTDPANKQVRGYILAMAKSSDSLYIYPSGAFAPKENILVNYTKGETFAVSRFREAVATFPPTVNEKDFQFQILLFRSDGKMISHQHVEKK